MGSDLQPSLDADGEENVPGLRSRVQDPGLKF